MAQSAGHAYTLEEMKASLTTRTAGTQVRLMHGRRHPLASERRDSIDTSTYDRHRRHEENVRTSRPSIRRLFLENAERLHAAGADQGREVMPAARKYVAARCAGESIRYRSR